ncbi:MAG: hypothetical protein WC756_12150 [Taibaiella sp.]|jgi:hypothetical protein
MEELNFDKQIEGLSNLYEKGKDALHQILPVDPEGQQQHALALTALTGMRDLCAISLQHINEITEIYKKSKIMKPHPDLDFVHEDRVYVENSDDTKSYFLLIYAKETADWVLIPYTDETFTEAKASDDGRTYAEPLSAFGYELLNRMDDEEQEEGETEEQEED